MMMKGDVLSGIETIKICKQYKIGKKVIDFFPFDIQSETVKPVYIDIPGWKENLTKINQLRKLPKEFTNYVEFLEKELQTPIKIISVGPDRKQTIFR